MNTNFTFDNPAYTYNQQNRHHWLCLGDEDKGVCTYISDSYLRKALSGINEPMIAIKKIGAVLLVIIGMLLTSYGLSQL